MSAPDTEYWNHNTAYHPWLVRVAAAQSGHVLDIGCGDGLLAQRLAPVSQSVTAIDPEPAALQRAWHRLAGYPDVTVIETGFEDFNPGRQRFDLITMVASLHHMDLHSTLVKARDLLTPSGRIAVVGLSANKTAVDWLWSGLCLPAVRLGSRLHHETRDIGVTVANPADSLDEIRHTAQEILPGAAVRRALYYRYLLLWRRPSNIENR